MGNENGAMNSGGTSPLSEYAPTESGRQRPSQSSTAQHSPTEAPEVDLSHLSEDERSQITSVIARAKHMQEEEIQRVRDLEEDYTSYAANVVRRASLVGAEQKEMKLCPICNTQELKSDNALPCVDCERCVCSACGRNDKNLQTGLEEWLCRICDKRRRLVLSTGLWYHGHHVGQDMPKVKGLREGELDEAILRHEFLERAASLPDEAIQELLAREAAAYRHGSFPLSFDDYQRLTFEDPLHMTEGERLLQMELALAERDYAMQMFELGEAASPKDTMEDSPSGRRKSPRPQHLILNRPQAGDSQIAEEAPETQSESVEKDLVRPAQETTKSRSASTKPDITSQQRVAGEGAEAPSAKKKPSALDRVALAEAHEPDRSQSPSRRSPRSPPRSPSWMRFRESPPRSPPMRVLSPTKSPTERFPSTFVERSSPSKTRDDTYGEEYTTTDMREFRFDQNAIAGSILDGRVIPDRPPPKPARLSGPYNFDDELEANELLTPSSLDLATYAATVASDTAHLTNMSVSPTNFVLQEPEHEYLDHDSSSPSSPQHYYDEADDIDVADPTPKSIDYQGSKRQKVRPPTSDWSPITDLSPILDVSPSIEIIEQEKMLAEQQKHLRDRDSEQSILEEYEYSGRPQLSEEKRSLEGPKQDKLSPLRRYQAFHDITAIGNGQVIETKENHSSSPQDMIHSIKTAKDISQEVEADRRLQKEVEERRHTPLTNNGVDYNNSCGKQDMSHGKHDHQMEKEKPTYSNNTSGIADTTKDSPVKKAKRSLPEPCAEIEPISRKVPLRGKEPKIMTRELRETKPSSVIKGKEKGKEEVDVDKVYKGKETDGKVRPQPLQLKQSKPLIRERDAEYEILKSPVSPGGKIERDYTQSKEVSPCVPSEHKAYMYPSPVTPPDPNTSPPQPQSPSVPRGKHRSSDIPSTMPQNPVGFQTNSAVSKMDKSVPHSPGSPSDKKVRRKLPQVPPGADPALIAKKQRSRSVDSYSREDKANADKETLRKRLKEKEAEARRAERAADIARGRARLQQASDKNGKNEANTKLRPKSAPLRKTADERPIIPPKEKTKVIAKVVKKTTVKTDIQETTTKKPIPPPKPVLKKKEPKVIETVNVYDLEVPVDVKSLKQRIKEELQIVTASKRLQLDEMHELHRLEREMKEREKQRQQKLEEAMEAKRKVELEIEEKEHELEKEREISLEREKLELESKYIDRTKFEPRRKVTPPATTLTARMSPQASPRRARHKRQNSDPMVAKFSPIEEDRDIENDLQYKLGLEARKIANDLSRLSPECGVHGRKISTVIAPASTDLEKKYAGNETSLMTGLSKSSELLSKYSLVEREARLSSSQSESCLPLSLSPRSRTPTYFSDDDDRQKKEEKKHKLQVEIANRKKQLDENARLQYEIRKLSEAADISRIEYETAMSKYQQHLRARDNMPTGIIKPLDYDSTQSEQYAIKDYIPYRETEIISPQRYIPQPSYSSTEYLVHKSDISPKEDSLVSISGDQYISDDAYPDAKQLSSSTYEKSEVVADKGDSLGYMAFHGSRDSGMCSNVTVPDPHTAMSDLDSVAPGLRVSPPFPAPCPTVTDPTATLSSRNSTPAAMPILEEVTLRSRKILRDMGSRPLSDEMDKYFQAEDPLTTMYRAESDQSIADSDDNIMEGGVTIRLQRPEHRKPLQPAQHRVYDYPTKRILLTRDPKDRSVKGNGIGMKIVGGKAVPGTERELGAFVFAIYPGGVADQLHGELKEGDQVLEWNGIPLTGRSYEEVQKIIAQPNGEIELVVKPGAGLGSKHSTASSTLRSDSCHSSYDNLDLTSDYEDYERFMEGDRGVDPDVLAAQLEEMKDSLSPGASPSSSQQEMFMTPSISMSGSSERTDPPSPSTEVPPGHGDQKEHNKTKWQRSPVKLAETVLENKNLGEIQLQLSFDDYDGTLNVHVIQAHNLLARDRNGFSDPFVKVYLLPGKCQENKRRTKYIARTLDPEWHQTLVFMNIPREELSSKTLEVTVWDYDRFKPNDFMGQILLDLSDEIYLDNKPHWYKLRPHDENSSRHLPRSRAFSPPPSSSSSTRSRGHSKSSVNGRSVAAASTSTQSQPRQTTSLVTPKDKAGGSYSPGLGRRKTQGSDKETKTTRHQSLDLSSIRPDQFWRQFSLDIENLAKLKNQRIDEDNNPLQDFDIPFPSLRTSLSSNFSSSSFVSSDTLTTLSFDSRVCPLSIGSSASLQRPFYESRTSSLVTEFVDDMNNISKILYSLGPGQVLSVLGAHVDDNYCVTGEVLIGLKWDQFKHALVVSVVHCKSITERIVSNSQKEWYVKLYLLCGNSGRKIRKKKTKVQICSTDPSFDEIFRYRTSLQGVYLEASLWINKGKFGINKSVGMAMICLDRIDFRSNAGNELYAYYKLLAR